MAAAVLSVLSLLGRSLKKTDLKESINIIIQ